MKKSWDGILRLLSPPILTLITVIVGMVMFICEQRYQTKLLVMANAIEFEQSVWKQQVDAYSSIAVVAGKFATNPIEAVANQELVQEFRSLYFGAVGLVQNELVEKETIKFNLEIHDSMRDLSNSSRVKRRALDLIEACRSASRELWKRDVLSDFLNGWPE